MEGYQDQLVNDNVKITPEVIPRVVPNSEIRPVKKEDESPELPKELLEMKEEAEGIVKSSMERLSIAEEMGIDTSQPKDTLKFYRHAVYQSDYRDALKVAKKIAIESAQIWHLALKKRIELAKNGKIDPAHIINGASASQNALGTNPQLAGTPDGGSGVASPDNGSKIQTTPKVPKIVRASNKKPQPPRPKVIATRKILQRNGKKQVQAKKLKKTGSMLEAIKKWFGKKDNSDIEARLARAEKILNRAKGLEDAEVDFSKKSLDDRMAKIESDIQDKIET